MEKPQGIVHLYPCYEAANNKIGAGGLKPLTKDKFDGLKVLSMSNCGITDEDLKDFVEQPWNNLESIWMSYNAFTAKGIQYFSTHEWPNLVSIHMSNE